MWCFCTFWCICLPSNSFPKIDENSSWNDHTHHENNTLAPLAQCEQGRESIEGTHKSTLVVKNFCHKLFPGSAQLTPN